MDIKWLGGSSYHSYCVPTLRIVLLITFTLLCIKAVAVLPQRTRWWNKKKRDEKEPSVKRGYIRQIYLGGPISEEEKTASHSLRASQETHGKHKYLESSRLHEGDIYMSPNWKLPQGGENRRVLQGLHTWSDGQVPYIIENSFDEMERLHVARAIVEIESKSCVRFVHRTDDQANFIYLHKGKDCASSVGRIGGGQPVSLAPRCIDFGIILHELLHTLGFWHEQSRYDRRKYVNIHWLNIKSLMLPNFFVSPYYVLSDVGLPYDYNSIMHYAGTSFAKNPNKPTISPKREGVEIGQRIALSELNVRAINLLYQCDTSNYAHLDQDTHASSFNFRHQRQLQCLDLWFFCFAPRVIGGCWWGDYLMRRYCRRACGLCS